MTVTRRRSRVTAAASRSSGSDALVVLVGVARALPAAPASRAPRTARRSSCRGTRWSTCTCRRTATARSGSGRGGDRAQAARRCRRLRDQAAADSRGAARRAPDPSTTCAPGSATRPRSRCSRRRHGDSLILCTLDQRAAAGSSSGAGSAASETLSRRAPDGRRKSDVAGLTARLRAVGSGRRVHAAIDARHHARARSARQGLPASLDGLPSDDPLATGYARAELAQGAPRGPRGLPSGAAARPGLRPPRCRCGAGSKRLRPERSAARPALGPPPAGAAACRRLDPALAGARGTDRRSSA